MLTTTHQDTITTLTLNTPDPTALATAIHTAITDPATRAIILSGTTATTQIPTTLTTEIESSPKPIVSTLDGPFALALACHARVLAPRTTIALPAVALGLIPGAGATQRLPRLAGALAALDIIATGRPVRASEALKLGIIDEIAADPTQAALTRARALADAGHWPITSARPLPPTDRATFDAACATIPKRARGALAPLAAAEAVTWALDLPFPEALARETARIAELAASPQSQALHHLAAADQAAASPPTSDAPRLIKHVGVIGGGTMGSGITIALLEAGYKVTLIETDLNRAGAAEARIRAVHARQLGAGRLQPAAIEDRLRRLTYSYRYDRLADADLVIEAIIEEMQAKQDVFRALADIVRPDCILASNTSRLDINALAAQVSHPGRVLGLHFFSPAHVMRLLEIVRAEHTDPASLATALALATHLKKQPIIAGVCDGFIGNRILGRWWAQCDFALEDGAYPEQVDAALEAYGFAMGPYAVADLAGLDIAWAGRKSGAATRNPNARDVKILDWLCEQGRFGQKTGKGWYDHTSGRRAVDPAVHALVERASAERGITRRLVPPDEIITRVLAAMVNEAAKLLAEGIALRPSDIDVALVHGYGFPAWRGGPMHAADIIGLDKILATVKTMQHDGPAFTPAPLLEDLVASGRTFASLNQGPAR